MVIKKPLPEGNGFFCKRDKKKRGRKEVERTRSASRLS
jgi:hypothetical protein